MIERFESRRAFLIAHGGSAGFTSGSEKWIRRHADARIDPGAEEMMVTTQDTGMRACLPLVYLAAAHFCEPGSRKLIDLERGDLATLVS
jgi:hypothetical protein